MLSQRYFNDFGHLRQTFLYFLGYIIDHSLGYFIVLFVLQSMSEVVSYLSGNDIETGFDGVFRHQPP